MEKVMWLIQHVKSGLNDTRTLDSFQFNILIINNLRYIIIFIA